MTLNFPWTIALGNTNFLIFFGTRTDQEKLVVSNSLLDNNSAVNGLFYLFMPKMREALAKGFKKLIKC